MVKLGNASECLFKNWIIDKYGDKFKLLANVVKRKTDRDFEVIYIVY